MIPAGFSFAAVNAGVKSPEVTRDDMALVVCDHEALLVGAFTRNVVKAAPVLIGREQVQRGTARAVVINAGNANACTGSRGLDDARAVMRAVAGKIGCAGDQVVPLSTGVIGVPLPVERMTAAAPRLAAELGPELEPCARAILTTDTCSKIASRKAGDARVVGFAKGSGMISPDMATTLAVVLTDAKMTREQLDKALHDALETSFNAVTVDGDTSTNDTLLVLSSGEVDADVEACAKAIGEVITDLALMVVRDGEGATKLVRIDVTGTVDRTEAKRVAMTVANSPLVKTAFFGEDPNWGRIMAAAGRSGVAFDPSAVAIRIAGHEVVRDGCEAPGYVEADVHRAFQEKEISLEIALGDGPGSFTVWTTDLSHGYVDINADYRT